MEGPKQERGSRGWRGVGPENGVLVSCGQDLGLYSKSGE